MLAIPKNLVYIFVGIVLFSFGAMIWITYTEDGLKKFLVKREKIKEVRVIDPLFKSLKESMKKDLGKERPIELVMAGFNTKDFFDHYLSEHRPVVIRQYAAEWKATQNWGDKEYLSEKAGTGVVTL